MQLMEKVPLYHNQLGDSKIIILYPIQNFKKPQKSKTADTNENKLSFLCFWETEKSDVFT